MNAFAVGVHAAIWLLGVTTGLLAVLLPVVALAIAVRLAWAGPLARAGWRVKAWRWTHRAVRGRTIP